MLLSKDTGIPEQVNGNDVKVPRYINSSLVIWGDKSSNSRQALLYPQHER
jgi:hypothetical protein